MDNYLCSVEKGHFTVNNRIEVLWPVWFSTEKNHFIHDLFTTYTNVVQDTFCESRGIIRTFHNG